MADSQTIFAMSSDDLKAIIDKTLSNAAKGKTNKQTNLNDAVRLLGVDGNWGTAKSRETVIAPGANLPSAPTPALQEKTNVWVNSYHTKNDPTRIEIQVFGSDEESKKGAAQFFKDQLQGFNSSIDWPSESDDIIDFVENMSRGRIYVNRRPHSITLSYPALKEDEASANQHINPENDLIAEASSNLKGNP